MGLTFHSREFFRGVDIEWSGIDRFTVSNIIPDKAMFVSQNRGER